MSSKNTPSVRSGRLGICRPAEEDTLCYGVWDNASGLLQSSKWRVRSRVCRRRRDARFCSSSSPARKRAWLGSDYFAHFPTVPIENIVADGNIDGAHGLLWPNKDVVPLGAEHSSLSKDVEAAAQNMGYRISPAPPKR